MSDFLRLAIASLLYIDSAALPPSHWPVAVVVWALAIALATGAIRLPVERALWPEGARP